MGPQLLGEKAGKRVHSHGDCDVCIGCPAALGDKENGFGFPLVGRFPNAPSNQWRSKAAQGMGFTGRRRSCCLSSWGNLRLRIDCYRGMQTNDLKMSEEAALKTNEVPANDRIPVWIPGLAQGSAIRT